MTRYEEICAWQSGHPAQTKALYFSWNDLKALKNQNAQVDGIRIYIGQDADNKLSGYANGCVGQNDYPPAGADELVASITKKAYPCPDFCNG